MLKNTFFVKIFGDTKKKFYLCEEFMLNSMFF